MMPFLTDDFANAASNHALGLAVNKHIKVARERIAKLIGCENHEIIFTSGSTEGINLALKGILPQKSSIESQRNSIVTLSTEHPAVLDTCKAIEQQGFNVIVVPVNEDGLVDLELLSKSLSDRTLMVCVMHVNNETGVIQPIDKIAALAHKVGAYFMTDATQSFGKIPIDVNKMGIDIMTFSGHKFYGPKGVGGLYVRSKPKVKLSPLIHGGGHERGFRSGTLNVPGIVGLGKASEMAVHEMEANASGVQNLRDLLQFELQKIPGAFLNGNEEKRIFNTLNIGFHGVDSDALMASLENVMISNGSACSSTKQEPSHVLLAMGRSPEDAYCSVRISLSKFNSEKEVIIVIDAIRKSVSTLRTMTEQVI